MNSIIIKKMIPKFDTDAICSGLPYRIIMSGNTYVGVFYTITEDRLEFKFFDKDETIKFATILPTLDDIEIYPSSVAELCGIPERNSDTDDRSAETMEASNNIDLKVEPENTDKPVEEDEPNIKSFSICDRRTPAFNHYPLFVRDNGDLIINYDFMGELLYDESVLISIRFGVKGHHSRACHTFKSKDVSIHVGGTTLTGKILDEHRNIITWVEIRSGDWKQLDWAHVIIKNKKDVTNNSSDK